MPVTLKDRLFTESVCKRASAQGFRFKEVRHGSLVAFAAVNVSTRYTGAGKPSGDRQTALVNVCREVDPQLT